MIVVVVFFFKAAVPDQGNDCSALFKASSQQGGGGSEGGSGSETTNEEEEEEDLGDMMAEILAEEVNRDWGLDREEIRRERVTRVLLLRLFRFLPACDPPHHLFMSR